MFIKCINYKLFDAVRPRPTAYSRIITSQTINYDVFADTASCQNIHLSVQSKKVIIRPSHMYLY